MLNFNFNTINDSATHLTLSNEDSYVLLINEIIQKPDYLNQIPKYLELKDELSFAFLQEYQVLDEIIKALVYDWGEEVEKSLQILCGLVKNIDKNSLIYKGNNNIYTSLNLYLASKFVDMGTSIFKSEYYREALRIYRNEDDYQGLAKCSELEAKYFNKIKDTQSELRSLQEAIKFYRFDNNQEELVKCQLKVASNYADQNNFEDWKKYIDLTLDKVNIAESSPSLKGYLFNSIGKGYFKFDFVKEASDYLRNSVSNYKMNGATKDLIEAYQLLETCYKKNDQTFEVTACQNSIRQLELDLQNIKHHESLKKIEIIHQIKLDEKLVKTKEEYENQITALKNKLDLTNEESGRMVVLLSHDLKEPIRGITSFVSLLDKSLSGTNTNEKEREYLHYIKRNANIIAGHIDHLLKYIQLDNNIKDVNEIDLNDLVREVKEDIMQKRKDKNVVLSYNKLPKVRANKEMMNLLFYNLLDNAIKFNKNSPLIKIDYNKNNNKPEIAITDNGIGISDENKEKVFELFRKEHMNNTYDGWGVGLSMSRKIVNQLGGDIKIEDNSNGGTKVKFDIAPEFVI
jgi:signal transduction histidine kinase